MSSQYSRNGKPTTRRPPATSRRIRSGISRGSARPTGGGERANQLRHLERCAALDETARVAVEQIDPRVDEAPQKRLLVDADDEVVVELDQPERNSCLIRTNSDGHLGAVLVVERVHRSEVDTRQDVAVHNEDRPLVLDKAERARGAERPLLGHVL